MRANNETPAARILTFVLLHDSSIAAAKFIRKMQVSSTTLMARGSISSNLLNALGIISDRREVIKLLMSRSDAEEFLPLINSKIRLQDPGNGIVYVSEVLACVDADNDLKLGFEDTIDLVPEGAMYNKITVIVDRGSAERIVEIAKEAGARGGTIMRGKGSAGKDAQKIFGIEIEPEKELAVIITPVGITRKVFDAIVKEAELELPGKGIIFVEPIVDAIGLVDSPEA
ncbi:MAG: hypothetical protein GX975_06355 [Clostridiales bacterium]|nr:hypothetical protein [Clostridiales bacterium]